MSTVGEATGVETDWLVGVDTVVAGSLVEVGAPAVAVGVVEAGRGVLVASCPPDVVGVEAMPEPQAASETSRNRLISVDMTRPAVGGNRNPLVESKWLGSGMTRSFRILCPR